METLEVAVELIDCGQASTSTRGLAYLVSVENGPSPFNTTWFFWY